MLKTTINLKQLFYKRDFTKGLWDQFALNNKLDLDRKVENAENSTVLWSLVKNSQGRELLLELAMINLNEVLELLEKYNLDAAPAQGPCAGLTVLWWLTGTPEGRTLWLNLAAENPNRVLALLEKCNLDVALIQGADAGSTVFWLLAANPEGRTLWLKLAEENPNRVLALFKKCNLDAAPTQGPNAGKTMLWLLAANSESQRLLKQLPQLLTMANFNLKVKNETIWDLVADDLALTKTFILLGADINLASEQQKNVLKDYQKNLLTNLQRGLKLFYRDIDHSLPDELSLKIVFNYLLTEHPELKFIKPLLPKIIEPQLGILLEEPISFIALASIRKWKMTTGARCLTLEEMTKLLQVENRPLQQRSYEYILTPDQLK